MDEGYRAFVPQPLPPIPAVSLPAEVWQTLSRAERAMGRLEAVVDHRALPEAAHGWLLRRDALASARLDGVRARLGDLLVTPGIGATPGIGVTPGIGSGTGGGMLRHGRRRAIADLLPPEVRSILALERASAELCGRARRSVPRVAMLRELHAAVAGPPERRTGPWRQEEIWIGPRGSTIRTARFVPPPPRLVPGAMEELDVFLGAPPEMAALVRAALTYHQIESIHPFAVAGGRVNRVFAQVLMAACGVAVAPFLGLSRYFLRDPGEYLGQLQRVREVGDWERWVDYFLHGIAWAAEQAAEEVGRLGDLREQHRSMLCRELPASLAPAQALLDALLDRPLVSVSEVAEIVDRTFANANQLVARFEELGILRETTGQQRNRRYRYEDFYRLLRR